MGELQHPQGDPRLCVQDGLETVELEPVGTVEDAVTVIDPVADEAVYERERVANHAQTMQLKKNRNDIAVRCCPPSTAHCPG